MSLPTTTHQPTTHQPTTTQWPFQDRARSSVAPGKEQIHSLLEMALLAPSADNSQPWRFTVDENGFDVWFDESRGTDSLDPQKLFPRQGLGSLLETARIAGTARGLLVRWVVSPGQGAGTHWARAEVTRVAVVCDDLASAIEDRCSNRRLFDRSALGATQTAALQAEVSGGVELKLFTQRGTISELARLVGLAERIRLETRTAHEDLHRWLRWSAAQADATRDGLDVRALELSSTQRLGLRFFRPWSRMKLAIPLGGQALVSSHTRKLAASSSALGVLRVRPDEAVAAGATLQRIWLRATRLGLAFSPLCALPTLSLLSEEVAASVARQPWLREAKEAFASILQSEADGRVPLMLFRIGRAQAPAVRSLRRPLKELLVSAAPRLVQSARLFAGD